jgi:hypothetical protein
MDLDQISAEKKRILDEFVELCRKGREGEYVHTKDFGRNLADHLACAEAEWEALFRNIAGTGVVVHR